VLMFSVYDGYIDSHICWVMHTSPPPQSSITALDGQFRGAVRDYRDGCFINKIQHIDKDRPGRRVFTGAISGGNVVDDILVYHDAADGRVKFQRVTFNGLEITE